MQRRMGVFIIWRRGSGFTFVELIICIGILGVLSALAMPNFFQFLNRMQLNSVGESLRYSLSFARSAAINRDAQVYVCALQEDRQSCSEDYQYNQNWSYGWMVFSDDNGNRKKDSTDTILQLVEIRQPISVVFNQRGRLRFFVNGSSRSAGFYVCSHQSQDARHIYLLYTGRARMQKGLSGKKLDKCRSNGVKS